MTKHCVCVLLFAFLACLAVAGDCIFAFEGGKLAESVPSGARPWVFSYTSDGVLGKCIQQGDGKVLDFSNLPPAIPPLKVIGDNAMAETLVEEVYLPRRSLEKIGAGAFRGCDRLRKIEPLLPDSVLDVGNAWSFMNLRQLEGTLTIGGGDRPMAKLPKDNRFIFWNLSKIGKIVFGAGVDQSYFTWSYGGFSGANGVTSIVCRVRAPLDWSQGISHPEGCRTCLFQDMKKLREIDLSGPLTGAAGLPELKSGSCRILVPSESREWRDFAANPGNVAVDGSIVAGNQLMIPEGYRLVFKNASNERQVWRYEESPAELVIDPSAKPIRDIAESSACPVLGLAGSLVGEGDFSKAFFRDDRENTALVFRRAGIRFVRQWDAVSQWQTGAGCGRSWRRKPGFNYEEYRVDMEDVFSFYRDYGIKALLTLENYSVYTDAANGVRTNDLAIVQKTICDYVRWICDNGFRGCVAGFELGNEPYWAGADLDKNRPEDYAARWIPIVEEIKAIWPEAPIGIALAEYMKGDPDVKAVRARMLSENRLVRGDYFDESTLNQWSARFVMAMRPVLDKISHVVYHAYGGAIAESCSYAGIQRYRLFTKAFPELSGKKFWISEWRERSDEDNRSHQRFHETLFKAGYMTMMLAQRDVDALNLHQINSLSGVLYMSGAAPASAPSWQSRQPVWCVSWDSAGKTRMDAQSIGKPRLEVGISGPVLRLYTEALLAHHLVMDYGSVGCGFQSQGNSNAVWSASKNYADHRNGDCQMLVTMNDAKTSIAILAVNTRNVAARLVLRMVDDYSLCNPEYRVYSCPEQFLFRHELPGEGKFTQYYGYEQNPQPTDPYMIEIPANSVTTVTIPMRGKK